jgi:tRNA 2-thiouridine synthesizing protein A
MSEPTAGDHTPRKPLVLDGGDRRCVQLLIELRRMVDEAEPGTVIHLITTDPAASLDLPAWCHLTGHDYLGVFSTASSLIPGAGAGRSTYGLRVRSGSRRSAPESPWRLG